MARTKTLDFLPSVFRSDPNRKFLNATLDQLVSEPNFQKINGYIGRKFAPTFKVSDNYVLEAYTERQNYQLEPGVVVSDADKNVTFFGSYPDLVQQLQYYGGEASDHSRLFNNEAYSFSGLVDFDKLVNFTQYYWVPNGPSAVDMFSGIDTSKTFTVTKNIAVDAYTFAELGTAKNPDIVLARGGSYKFLVDQPGSGFWIQTDPGDGTRAGQININTRAVYGVDNNGDDIGIVTFNVPTSDAQDFFLNMPEVYPTGSSLDHVDIIATTSHFDDIDNELLINVVKNIGGVDGLTSDLAGKYLVFVGNDPLTEDWTERGVYGLSGWDDTAYDAGEVVPSSEQSGVWQINLIDTGDGDQLVKLVYITNIPVGHKVTITTGETFSNIQFYKKPDNTLSEVPFITAPLNTFFYCCGSNSPTDQNFIGRIRIIDNVNFGIDVEEDILGKTQYVSPNGVVFTNGLKVKFDDTTIPVSYANKVYCVEGVGKSIRLVLWDSMITPELSDESSSIPFDIYAFDEDTFDEELNGPLMPDYITINRSSIDGNAWSRSNRWFHQDVIISTANYNEDIPLLDNSMRATRPIIEFDPDIQLFGSGQIYNYPVDLLDFTVTDAMTQVEGEPASDSFFYTNNLRDGAIVIFANDFDPIVLNKIFKINVLDINNVTTIHLTIVGSVQAGDDVVPLDGSTVPLNFTGLHLNPDTEIVGQLNSTTGLITGSNFWFDGTIWREGQKKSALNEPPIFDIVNKDGISFSNNSVYDNTSFKGSKIFSYRTTTDGINDPILGFPLSYRNINNIGDIEFNNNIDLDTFTYLSGLQTQTVNINTGYIPKIVDRNTVKKVNVWETKSEPTKQYQIISGIFNGVTSYFEIDILPVENKLVPNTKVYVNSKLIDRSLYSIVSVGSRYAVHIPNLLTLNDQVDILIYSTSVSNKGYYEIPLNLDFNALNQSFTSLTLGQFRNHLQTIAANSLDIVGLVPGSSNIRDLDIKPRGGSILQHSSPVIYSSLFLTNPDINFVDSVSFAQREYEKFKNRFLESYNVIATQNITDAATGVDLIMAQLNVVKNKSSPWYYSDMVPYDANRTVITYSVLDQTIPEYEIDAIFNDTRLSRKAILVYLNGVQLVKGIDFDFVQTRPSIIFHSTLDYNSQIDIHIFDNTDGSFVPETPSKLGVYPKFVPEKYLDETYQTPTYMIRGHDGSLTPAFNDFRDDLLLELERRIYNNIKVVYDPENFDVADYIPGQFRDTEYSKAEFDQIISNNFLNWIGSNRIDFNTNKWFQSNNPWTWTYSGFRNILDESFLPGYWRGIYHYFYDTDAPNLHPWEMLGFSEMPIWWIDEYGPAPYTGGNLVMWSDLEKGLIKQGPRAGIDTTYIRPGLTSVIPVTDSGELISPEQFLLKAFNGLNASGTFSFGDEGPVETAWRRSSNYPFAVQQALAIMKPAIYFSQLVNVQSYSRRNELGQFVVAATNQRVTPEDILINGDTTSDTTTVRAAGYLNWIIGYLVSNGLDPVTTLNGYLDNLDVRLGYKAAGYTDKSYLTVLADQISPTSTNQSVIIPDENYQIILHKSTPVDRIVYSAVIIEKSATGYVVSGYDLNNPFFTIVPSNPSSNQYTISVNSATGVIYGDYQAVKVTIPYGYEFNTKQQVVDFLVSYGRYLLSQGFTFSDFSTDLQTTQDWTLAVKEFLTWTQQGWGTGNIVVLSPVANSIKIVYPNAVVDAVLNLPSGSKILDVNFNVIKNNLFNVVRDDTNFTLTTTLDISIGLVDLSLVQYEHALIFDNQTVFNDIIYKPELGNRQYRLKLIGNKTGDWTGQVNPPGFIYSNPIIDAWSSGKDYGKGDIVSYKKVYYTALQDIPASSTFTLINQWQQINASDIQTGLLPNFSYNAQKFENFYDVDNLIGDENIDLFSNGLIGYRERPFLSDLGLDSTSQVKFYQGYIKDKGTKNSIYSLSSAIFNNLSGELQFNEEWAFRVGEYGAIDSNQFLEIQLDDATYTSSPIAFSLLDAGQTVRDTGVVQVYKENLYKKPLTFKTNIINARDEDSNTENDIKSAGYVNLADINATMFNIQDYQELDTIISQIHSGYKIWVAKDVNRDWNVYRVDELSVNLINVTYALDGYATFTTSIPHGLVVRDTFVVRNFSTEVDGFYQVLRVDSTNAVFVSITTALEKLMITVPVVDGQGVIFKLSSMRFNTLTDIVDTSPINGWRTTDNLWVDNDTADGKWGTYQKVFPWEFDISLPGVQPIANVYFGQQVAMTPDGTITVVTSPGATIDNIKLIAETFTDTYTSSAFGFDFTSNATVTIGNTLTVNQDSIVVSAENQDDPTANEVWVHKLTGSTVSSRYILTESGSLGYGTSMAISKDNQWLYVGAPSANKVYAYQMGIDGQFSNVAATTLNGVSSELYGYSLATNDDGSFLVIGAPKSSSAGPGESGRIDIYQRVGLLFIHIVAFTPPSDLQVNGHFGYSLCMTGNGAELLVGAPGYYGANYHSGAVYRYLNTSTLGSILYVYNETILKPYTDYSEHFGTLITVDEKAKVVFISSTGAYTISETVLDSAPFELDGGTTEIVDRIPNTGAVYVYDLITDPIRSKYIFNQELVNDDIATGDKFGISVAANGGRVVVGAPRSDAIEQDMGKAQLFTNLNYTPSWSKIRSELPKVDLNNLIKVYLYNSKQQSILALLDHIDPFKGKILGAAEQNITFKTSFDPAAYNVGSNSSVTIDTTGFYWGAKQVGQVWWDLSTVRYVDYEQDTLTYRINNWGRLFPGASIDVYEWVESATVPSAYAGEGTPKFKDNSAYVQEVSVNSNTGVITSKYYFWVSGKTSVDKNLPFRTLPLDSIATLIQSPQTQGIPYAAVIQNNSFALFSSENYISADTTILHIDYALLQNDNIIHNEYELVPENLASAIIPAKIVNKLVDSLTGADSAGNVIPDYSLGVAERYGISIRPRQTMIVNRLKAVQNFVEFVNDVFAQYPIVEQFDISPLDANAAPPAIETLATVTYIDSATTTFDMGETIFDVTTGIVVNTLQERSYLDLSLLLEGQKILVLQDATFNNEWAVYSLTVDKTFKLDQTQSYRTADFWSKVDWYDSTYDPTVKPTHTVETLPDMGALSLANQDVVFVKNNGSGRFSVYRVNDDLTTTLVGLQSGTIQLSDALWAFDTNQIGFGNDSFDIGKFDLNPTVELRVIFDAIKSNIFINTLDGQFNQLFFTLLNYIFSEQRFVDWAFKTSFVSIFHALRKLEQFPNFIRDNQTYYEDYINEVKPYRTKIREYKIDYQGEDSGNIHPTDFDLPSYYDTDFQMWRSPNGEHARDATILSTYPQYVDWFNNYTMFVDSVTIENPGLGYHEPPSLTVVGGGGSGAELMATIDFFSGAVTNVLVIKPGTGYTSTPTIQVSGGGGGTEQVRCYPMMDNGLTRAITVNLKFDRITYEADAQSWTANTGYSEGDIVVYNSAVYEAKTDLTTLNTFDPLDWTKVGDSVLDNAINRVFAFYKPGPGQPPSDPKQLFSGIEYPGILVDGVNYKNSENLSLDSYLQSFYTDLELGTRPEDVLTNGGKYVDVFSSHAPEEFLPGIVFDTLDIKVFTINPDDPTNGPLGYRISKTMLDETKAPDILDVDNYAKWVEAQWEFRRICAASTTTLIKKLLVTDTVIYVADASVLPIPSPNLGIPGIVYINGEKISYYGVDLVNNTLSLLRRGTWGTGAPKQHAIGSSVVDASLAQKIPGDTYGRVWLNPGSTTAADGNGLMAATTTQANFLKACATGLPFLPGESGIHFDPNAFNTRFDDDGLDEVGTPTHPFDQDPFDSYITG